MNRDKYLVVKGLAGLGNRMLSALTGIVYAHLSGRKLYIDWNDPSFATGSNAFHDLLMCPLFDRSDKIPHSNSVNPLVWLGNLESPVGYMRAPKQSNHDFWKKTSVDLSRIDYEEDVLVMWTYNQKLGLLRNHFAGRREDWLAMSDKAILSMLLKTELVPSLDIQERIRKFRDEHFIGKTVGVHIRYTDHQASLLSILTKLDSVLKQDREFLIFLATDNVQIKKLIEENYGNVITTPHWYPMPGARIHDNKACPDRLQSGIESIIDLYLLAECDYLILDTSSTFSYVARLLAKTDGPRIYDAKRSDKLTPRLRWFSWRAKLGLGVFSWGLAALSKFERFRRWLIR